jgi:tetratricopeptide (TPR) repeat protein
VTLRGHEGSVTLAVLSPNGEQVLTTSEDGTVRVWPVDPLRFARKNNPRSWTPAERALYLIDTPEEKEDFESDDRAEYRRDRRAWEAQHPLDEAETLVRAQRVDGAYRALRAELARALATIIHQRPLSANDFQRAVRFARLTLEADGSQADTAIEEVVDFFISRAEFRSAIVVLEERDTLNRSLREKLTRCRGEVAPDLVSYPSIDDALEHANLNLANLIVEGSQWRFFRGHREPSAGLEWTSLEYCDELWDEGPSGFGYGDEDDATVLRDMRGHYTTVYVRGVFEVEDPQALEPAVLSVRADDGFIAYLNGQEVFRRHTGEPGTRAPFAATASGIAEEPLLPQEMVLAPEALRAGRNVLALQGLNRSKVSSCDFSLIPVLSASFPRTPERDQRLLEEFRSGAGQGASGNAISTEPSASVPLRRHYLQGRILQRAGKQEEAVKHFEEILAVDRMRESPFLALCESLQSLGRFAEAEGRLRSALESGLDGSSKIWDFWGVLNLVDLRRSPEQVLGGLPGGPGAGEEAAQETLRKDLAWILRQILSESTVHINCGGGEFKDSKGQLWGKDRFFSGGRSFCEGAGNGRRRSLPDTAPGALDMGA